MELSLGGKLDRHGSFGANCLEILGRARQRLEGESVPVTFWDEVWSKTMIDFVTEDFERSTRLSLLTCAIANPIAGIRPTNLRAEVTEDVAHLLRERVDYIIERGLYLSPKKEGRTADERGILDGRSLDPYDFIRADTALDRALRRSAGETIEITEEDLLGTLALIDQLMTGLDYTNLIDITACVIAREFDGKPPDSVFSEFDRMTHAIIQRSDLMNAPCDGPMH